MKHLPAVLVTLSLTGIPLFSQDEPALPPPATTPVSSTAPAVVTLGEFAIRAALGLGIQPPQGGFTPEGAAWSLVQKGVKVRPELGTPVTEADAVDALTQLGFKIRTTTPSRVVSRDRFEILCGSFFTPAVMAASKPALSAAPEDKH